MPAALRFGLKRGVRSSPTAEEAGGQFCSDAINVFSTQAGIEKRAGSRPIFVSRYGAVPGGCLWGTWEDGVAGGPAPPWSSPASGAQVQSGTPAANEQVVLFFGNINPPAPTTWSYCRVKATFTIPATTTQVPFSRPTWYALNAFDGTAEELKVLDCTMPTTDGAGWTNGIGFASVTSGGPTNVTQVMEVAFVPPTCWDVSNGETQIFAAWPATQYPAGVTCNNVEVTPVLDPVVLTEPTSPSNMNLRTVCITTWRDRAGAPHVFHAHTWCDVSYGDTLRQVLFFLDGELLTDVGGIGGVQDVPEDQKVEAFYHPATDRLIGHIAGGNWFYIIPGDGNVYLLEAFSEQGTAAAAANPFASDLRGLRPTMPQVSTAVVHDGRIFSAVGETLLWSAPDAYPDTWPNSNERFLADGGGPITAMCSIGAALVVAKRDMVYLVQPTGEPQGYDAVPVVSGAGSIGAITPCGSFALMVGDDGLYVVTADSARKVTDQLDSAFLEGRLGDLSRAIGAYHSGYAQWRLFHPSNDKSICDRALYVDLEGWTPDTQGDKQSELGIWPQGPYARASTYENAGRDPGFLATAVCADFSGPRRRILFGTAHGVILEMDIGTQDHGTTVKSRMVQAPFNVGGSGGVMINRLKVALDVDSSRSITFGVIPNGWEAKERTCPVTVSREAGYSTNGAFPASFATWDTQGFTTFLQPFTRTPDFAARMQTMQVTMRDEGEGSLVVHMIAADVAPGNELR